MSVAELLLLTAVMLVLGIALGHWTACVHIQQKHTNGWGDDVFGPRR